MTCFLTCPPHVRSAHVGEAIVLVDSRTARVDTLLGYAHHLWLALARTGDVQAAAHATGIDSKRADHLAQQLRADGLLEATPAPRPWEVAHGAVTTSSWGTQEVSAGLAPAQPLPWGHLVLAVPTLVAVLLVRHAGRRRRSFARMIALLRAATRRPCRHASPQAVDQALHCVRHMANFLPCRIACLEESIAAMLVLAATGQSAIWCHGVATDPIRLHAWLTVNGVAVGEPASIARYTPLLQVPDASRTSSRKETG
ncbi:MAG: lasso peptide biosynthesis B2 protein [Pseudonocardiaceae bacterium]